MLDFLAAVRAPGHAQRGTGVILATLLLVIGCGPQRPGPEVAAREWMQALATQDGLKLGELTCDAAQGVLATRTALYSAVGIAPGAAAGGAEPRLSTDELKYETTRNDGNTADVRVTGRLRVAVLATSTSQEANFVLRMARDRDKWRYCGDVSTASRSASQTSARAPSDPTRPPVASTPRASGVVAKAEATTPTTAAVYLEVFIDLDQVSHDRRNGILEETSRILEKRLEGYGIVKSQMETRGRSRLVIGIPPISNVSEANQLVSETAWLDFRERDEATGIWKPAIANGRDGQPKWLTSQYFSPAAKMVSDALSNQPMIQFKLNQEGALLFEQITRRLINRPLGIFLDDKMISTPMVTGVLRDGAAITGLRADEAARLTIQLNAGYLPVRISGDSEAGLPGRKMPVSGSDHIREGTIPVYQTRPPTSGPHYPTWEPNYGVHEKEVPVGKWVHNLEHGGIVLLYKCSMDCPNRLSEFRELHASLPKGRNAQRGNARLLIVPYADMGRTFAVVAWGRLLELDEFDPEQITEFYEAFIDRGPECQDLRCPD